MELFDFCVRKLAGLTEVSRTENTTPEENPVVLASHRKKRAAVHLPQTEKHRTIWKWGRKFSGVLGRGYHF